MKMKNEHYTALKNGMRISLNKLKNKGINNKNELIDYYTNNKIGKNHTDRACFDLLNVSIINNTTGTKFICDILYQYLNDTHINTALNRIMQEL